jgi:hypothetical protein
MIRRRRHECTGAAAVLQLVQNGVPSFLSLSFRRSTAAVAYEDRTKIHSIVIEAIDARLSLPAKSRLLRC